MAKERSFADNSALELPILGVVPEDINMQSALVLKDAIVHTHPKSKSAKAYRMIAARLIGNHNYKEPSSLMEKIFG